MLNHTALRQMYKPTLCDSPTQTAAAAAPHVPVIALLKNSRLLCSPVQTIYVYIVESMRNATIYLPVEIAQPTRF